MSKELEALGIIIETLSNDKGRVMCRKELDVLIQALQRLDTIDNAKPSEAFEWLEKLGTHRIEYKEGFELGYTKTMPFKNTIEYKIIQQALLKAQEQEKVLEILKNKDVDIYTLTALIENKGDNALKMYNDDFYIDSYRRLTEEEFELIKKHFNKIKDKSE